MAQYRTGTVAVTSGSNVVVGTGTAWLSNAGIGHTFKLRGIDVTYEVAAVISDTELRINGFWEGADLNGQAYQIGTSFTPISGLPYPEAGDVETAAILKRALLLLDHNGPQSKLSFADMFADYLVSGLVPSPSANLTTTTPAGRAYVAGIRVVKLTDTSYTYPANADVYVDLSSTGVFSYAAVVNGAPAPAAAPEVLRLFKVVTDAAKVTSVTRLAPTSAAAVGFNADLLDGKHLAEIQADAQARVDAHAAAQDPHQQYVLHTELNAPLNDRLATADLLTDYVVSGLLGAVPTPASLDLTTPAGAAYVAGRRVSVAASSYTYPASSDTYDDLTLAGAITHTAVASGAAAPALAAGSIRLQRVVTDAAAITAVADLRPLVPTVSRSLGVPDGTAPGHAINKGQLDAHLAAPDPHPQYATDADLSAHTGAATGAHAASAISYTPAGNLAATDVAAALNELDAEKSGLGLANAFTQPQTAPEYRVGDANKTLRRRGSNNEYLSIENADGGILPVAALDFQPSANAYWNDTNWMRYDTAQPAAGIFLHRDGRLLYRQAPAGANPIVWAEYPIMRGGLSHVRAHLSAAQSIAAETFTKVAFGNAIVNVLGNYDAAQARFTTPEFGVYDVSATVMFNSAAAGQRILLSIFTNGNETSRGTDVTLGAASDATAHVSDSMRLAAGDTIELYAYSSASCSLRSEPQLSWLNITRVQ